MQSDAPDVAPATDDLRLEPAKLIATAQLLEKRIGERFEGSGLARVCAEVVKRTMQAEAACEHIRRPQYGLRIASGALAVVIVLAVFSTAWFALEGAPPSQAIVSWTDLATVSEAVANEIVLLGAVIWFFVSFERKRKRDGVLGAMNQLRTLAHLIDIHQLSKSPETIGDERMTASSPERDLDAFEMGRYLDYCTEMLALTAKVAALYGEAFEDAEANEAVNDLEELCIGLSAKIWQKIVLLETRAGQPGFADVR